MNTHHKLALTGKFAVANTNEGVVVLPLSESRAVDVGREPAYGREDPRVERRLKYVGPVEFEREHRTVNVHGRPACVQPSATTGPCMVGRTLARCPPRHIPVADQRRYNTITVIVCTDGSERQTCYPTVAVLERT